MEEVIKINVEKFDGQELIIRHGDAVKVQEPQKVSISGVISAPYNYLVKRVAQVDQLRCYITVNRDRRAIILVVDESSHYATHILGVLELSPIFRKFKINTGEYRTPLELAEFIKMHRAHFDNTAEAMELVSILRNFRAKVNKEVDRDIDLNKGDRNLAIRQVVDSNIPKSFKINIPIFNGIPAQTIEVETYFNPDDLTCSLVSPQANEIAETTTNSHIDIVLDMVAEIAPSIVIIEI